VGKEIHGWDGGLFVSFGSEKEPGNVLEAE